MKFKMAVQNVCQDHFELTKIVIYFSGDKSRKGNEVSIPRNFHDPRPWAQINDFGHILTSNIVVLDWLLR